MEKHKKKQSLDVYFAMPRPALPIQNTPESQQLTPQRVFLPESRICADNQILPMGLLPLLVGLPSPPIFRPLYDLSKLAIL